MKLIPALALGVVTVLLAGCAGGAYAPKNDTKYNQETRAKFVLMDSGAQRSVTSGGAFEEKTLADGRLEVGALLRNREERRIQVQVQCVFKDTAGFSTGDETPWENVILTENGMETVRFTSLNSQAKNYTIRVRQAR